MPLFDHREYSEDAPGAASLSGCCGFAHEWMESSSKPQNNALIRFASIESYVLSLQESCGKLQRDKVEEQNNIQKLSHEVDCLSSKIEAMTQDEKKLTAKLETLGDFHETLQKDFAAKFDALCSQTEVARAELKESKQSDVRKESCIKALTDLNKEMKILVDAQRQELENVLEISQQKNMEKEKCIKELAFELGTSRGIAKELTAELDALRQKLQQDMIERANTIQKLSAEVISCKCDLQELHQNMVFCTSNCKNCAEMAQIERFRAAHMTKLVHRMHDLRKLLQRGLDYEPLEKLEDIFRLLADATSPLCGVHGVYSGTGPLPEDDILKLSRVFSNNQVKHATLRSK
jgi:chromosome segregation ATPase